MLYLDDNIAGFDLETALPLLSEQRREQVLRFRHEQGRKTCAMVYRLLCRGLLEEYGFSQLPVFEYGEHGKPSIVGHPEIFFSLSHCRQAVACAISDRPIGVDVESVRPYRESLVRYTMNDAEQQRIKSAEHPDVEFTRLWTMKEAVVKRSGRGITGDIKHVLDNLPLGNTLDGSVSIETVVDEVRGYVYSVCE
jgi:4'-phosphopantetheinyl transferase